MRHRLGEQEHIGWSRAGERGHRVHQRLVTNPFHGADRGQQRVDERALFGRDAGICDHNRDAAADRGRRIRHGANERGLRQRVREESQRAPRHDGYDHGRVANEWRQRRHGLGRGLRFDRENHCGDLANGIARGIEAQAAPAQRRNFGAGLRLDHRDIGGGKAEAEPALEHGATHLAGAGEMGGAMLEGWLRLGFSPANVAVIEPQPSPEVAALSGRGLRLNPPRDAVGEVAAVVLAVKPQAALVRAMPNTPAAIGRGITVMVANSRISPEQRALVDALLSAVGTVEWISDETLMDAVTALSGSGPAYVFLLAEAMAHAGAAAGLPPALAATLARATVAGSGELLQRSPLDPATLRQNVTSPGGTTAAALDVLMGKDGLERLMTAAIAAATKRSRDLAG